MKRHWAYWDIYVRDGFICQYCGADALAWDRWDLHSIDHLVPLAAKGTEESINLVVVCRGCNGCKAGYDPSLDGADPLSPDSRNRLIARATDRIKERRAIWRTDFMQMLKDGGRLTIIPNDVTVVTANGMVG